MRGSLRIFLFVLLATVGLLIVPLGAAEALFNLVAGIAIMVIGVLMAGLAGFVGKRTNQLQRRHPQLHTKKS